MDKHPYYDDPKEPIAEDITAVIYDAITHGHRARADKVKGYIDHLRQSRFIPGEYKCPKCGFVLLSSVMSAETGDISANRSADQVCPNDGTRMEPVTWEAAAREARDISIAALGIVNRINELRAGEGSAVTICCENPEGDGTNNHAVDCFGEWTNWLERRFEGPTLLAALDSAIAARSESEPKDCQSD